MDIQSIINQMTLEQKISLCTGADSWHTIAIKELSIPSLTMSDGTSGVRFQKPRGLTAPCNLYDATVNFSFDNEAALENTYEATCYPSGSALACSWSPALAREIGAAVATECKARGIGLLLGPGMNIRRHPLTARNFEYYSEDPCLSGEMAAGMITGIQGEGVGACVKHFACNNSDTRRTRLNCIVEPRALHEIYLAGFERAIKKAAPAAVMGAYNQINGEQACENSWLLSHVLRDLWGFKGAVLSDWGAVKDSVKAVKAGLDLQMPHSIQYIDSVKEALETGRLSVRDIDEHCERILTLVFTYSMEGRDRPRVDWESHHRLAQRAACESAVLLKNQDSLLPVSPETGMKIAVLGQIAQSPLFQGTGCAIVNARQIDIPLDEIRKAGGESVLYAKGYLDGQTTTEELLTEAARTAKEADLAVVMMGTYLPGESDDYDHKNMDTAPAHRQLLERVTEVQENTIVILFNGNTTAMPWAGRVKAILQMGYAGEGAGKALADLLFGNACPGGKLAATIPESLSDTPAYLDFPHEHDVCRYREGIFTGYRYYDKRCHKVLFPFGYGLSYTTFACSDLEASFQPDAGTYTVSLTVTNTGSLEGSQVIQLYVSPPKGPLFRPVKELKSFAKVMLKPNEKRKIIFILDDRDLACYDEQRDQWVTLPGVYTVKIGFDSGNLPESIELNVDGGMGGSADSRTAGGAAQGSHSRELLKLDSHYSDIFENQAATEEFFRFLVEQGLLEPEQAGSPVLMKELKKTFWGFAQHLDMNSSGRITPELSRELLERMNRAISERE